MEKSRKARESENKRDKRNRFIFWTLRLVWFLIIDYAASYWKHFGWWFLLLCMGALLLGLIPIEKRLTNLEDRRRERKIQKKYPFVKELEDGKSVTIVMKNGEVLKNTMLISRFETEMLIIIKSQYDKDFNDNDIRTIKLKKVKTIKPIKAGE